MGDDPTCARSPRINAAATSPRSAIDVAPGIASCTALTGGGDWDCKPAGGTYALATAKDGKAIDTMDVAARPHRRRQLRPQATIALYRPNGEVAEIYARRSATAAAAAGRSRSAPNGKDDDGDGMIDDHFAEGATDPDPGCTSTTDTSENSELLPAGDCEIEMDVFEDDPRVAGAVAEGCGVIQGFWFHAPGTVDRLRATSSATRAPSRRARRCARPAARCSTRRPRRWAWPCQLTAAGRLPADDARADQRRQHRRAPSG